MDVNSPEAALWSENMSLKSQNEYLRSMLQKIAELRYVEDANEPFDDALDLADEALAAPR